MAFEEGKLLTLAGCQPRGETGPLPHAALNLTPRPQGVGRGRSVYVTHTRVAFKVFSSVLQQVRILAADKSQSRGKEKQKLALASHFSELLTWCTMCDAVFAAAPPWSVLHLPEKKGHMSL